jgi:recombination protein RecA
VDSVAALVSRAELEGEMGDAHVGLQARLMSQALRKLVGAVSKSKTCLVFTNQIREKVGVMFGNPEVTPGGRALKFYSSVRIEVRRIETLKQGQETTGIRVRAKIVKNKVAPPFRQAEFDILYGQGISREGDLIDIGAELGVVTRSGTWYSYGSERLGQGRDNAREFLRGRADVAETIELRIREAWQGGQLKAAVAAGEEGE